METLARSHLLPSNEEVVELPLLILSSVVLFPGETLPLRLWQLEHIRLVLHIASAQRRGQPTFLGILNAQREMSGSRQALVVGCTCELVEVDSEWDGSSAFLAKTRGRQRFQVLCRDGHQAVHIREGVPHARVRILSDDCPSALRRSPQLSTGAIRRHQSTYWPSSVASLLSAHCLVRKAQRIIDSVAAWEGIKGASGLALARLAESTAESNRGQPQKKEEKEDDACAAVDDQDPVAFSFRLASSLPLDDFKRQQLLSTESIVYRLKLELDLLRTTAGRKLCCAGCENALAKKTAVFSVPGAEGTVGNYSNPAGIIHQTLTLRELMDGEEEAVFLEGEAESEDSWFLGYAWTIAYCRLCSLHLGWLFTYCGTDPGEGARLPRFWGIRRAALRDEVNEEEEQEEHEEEEEEWEEDEEGGEEAEEVDDWIFQHVREMTEQRDENLARFPLTEDENEDEREDG